MPTTTEQAEQAKQATERKADIAHGFDLVADTFGAGGHSDGGSFFESVGRRLVRHAALRPGDRVLDLGCGRGAVLFAAAEAVGADGYAAGIDLSPEMVRATAAEIGARGLRNVAVRVDDAEDPGYPARSFEAVTAGLMMFVTPDPAAVLTSAHRVLTPGGRFAMSTFGPADPAWQRPLLAAVAVGGGEAAVRKWGGDRHGDGRFDTPELIAALLGQAGFTEPATVEEEQVSTYAEAEDWWTSLWSGGRRAALLAQIPEERRAEARGAAFAELEPLTVDGVLTRRTSIRYTTALRT